MDEKYELGERVRQIKRNIGCAAAAAGVIAVGVISYYHAKNSIINGVIEEIKHLNSNGVHSFLQVHNCTSIDDYEVPKDGQLTIDKVIVSAAVGDCKYRPEPEKQKGHYGLRVFIPYTKLNNYVMAHRKR